MPTRSKTVAADTSIVPLTAHGTFPHLRLKLVNLRSKFHDFQRTFLPIVFPANDHFAPINRMLVLPEVATDKLEFDTNSLPLVSPSVNAAFRLTVRECGLD